MSGDPARLARLATEHWRLRAMLARFAGTLETVETPLARLLQLSDDIATAFVYAEHRYRLAFLPGDPAGAELAIEGYMAVLDAAKRLPEKEAAEVEQLLADRIALLAGGPDKLAERAENLSAVADRRAAKRVERLARRMSGRDPFGAATRIEAAILRAVNATQPTPAQEALLMFLRTVPPNDHLAWRRIGDELASFKYLESKLDDVRAAGGIEQYGVEKFKAVLETEANGVQGVAGEQWVLRSTAWRMREHTLMRTGYQRGRRLGAGGEFYRPVVFRHPLHIGREEIYDASVLLVRPLTSGQRVRVFDAYLHGTLQVQFRNDPTLLKVLGSDFERELEKPGGLVLRTLDQTEQYIVRSAPDGMGPTRYMAAPGIDRAKHPVVPPGANVVFLPALPTRDQMNDIAYLLISEFL